MLVVLPLLQLPGLVEQTRVGGFGIVRALVHFEDCEIAVARGWEIAGPVGPRGGQSAIDYDVVVRAQGVGIDHRRQGLSGREVFADQRYCIFSPLQWQLAVEFCDPAIAARVTE